MADESVGCAWVTGASSGIGRQLCLALARDGWRVAAAARNRDRLRALAEQAAAYSGSIRPVPLDVRDQAAVDAAVAEIESSLGPIDLAVLNAGTHEAVRAGEFKAATVRNLMDINVMGTANCLEAVIGRMIARRSGRIAVVGSLAGYFGLPTAAAYGATKAALIAMAEALKPELDQAGVTIQVVNPGFVRTPLTDRNRFPMPFLMEPEDAVRALLAGLRSRRFEIVFPCRFVYLLKLLQLLPYPLAFAVTRRFLPDDDV